MVVPVSMVTVGHDVDEVNVLVELRQVIGSGNYVVVATDSRWENIAKRVESGGQLADEGTEVVPVILGVAAVTESWN